MSHALAADLLYFITGQGVCWFFDSWTLGECQETDEFLWRVWPVADRMHTGIAASQAIDIWGRKVHTSENLIAYRDFFVRKIRQTSGVRFINATEGEILNEGVEILSLRDALYRYCSKPLEVRRMLRSAHSPLPAGEGKVRTAIRHLSRVLQSRVPDCGCLNAFLDLTAKRSGFEARRRSCQQEYSLGMGDL